MKDKQFSYTIFDKHTNDKQFSNMYNAAWSQYAHRAHMFMKTDKMTDTHTNTHTYTYSHTHKHTDTYSHAHTGTLIAISE
jgi:hypothetical protein